MANYVLVYHGGSMPATPEEVATVTKTWTEWFTSLGDAVVDGGNPATRTKSIAANGSVSDVEGGPSGYSIFKAGSLDEAVDLAKGCPVLRNGGSIQVVETIAMM